MKRTKNEKIAFNKGYYVDDKGNIFNSNNITVNGNYTNGYKVFNIRDEKNNIIRIRVHRLVGYQKFGDEIYDENKVIRHLDNNSKNNCVENIGIGTYHDNRMDMPENERLELSKNANKNQKFLNDDEIIDLQKQYSEGYRMKYLMKKFNIKSKGTYSNYINKKMIQ